MNLKEQEDKIKQDTEQKFKSQLEAKDKEIETSKGKVRIMI